MKVAYRTADPKNIIAFGAAITKETGPVGHLLVTAADGGSRVVEYSAFANLAAGDITISNYAGAAPSPFKADASHAWNGSAPVATDYVFPSPPGKQPAPMFDAALFLKAMVTGMGGVEKANDIVVKYPIIILALLTAKSMEWDKGNVKALIDLAKAKGDLTDQDITNIRAAWTALSGQ